MTMDNSPLAGTGDSVPGRPGAGHEAGGTSSPERMSDEAGQQARRAAGAAREQMGRAAESTKEAARQAKDQAGRVASDAGRMAREQGAALFEQQKGRAVGQLHAVGDAVHRAADRLHEQHDDNIAGYADAMADRIQSCAQYLEQRDLSGLVREGKRLARREPEWFLGGMFVAGLALTRFLKASASRDAEDYPIGRGDVGALAGRYGADDAASRVQRSPDDASAGAASQVPPLSVPAPNPNPLPAPGATSASSFGPDGGRQPGGFAS